MAGAANSMTMALLAVLAVAGSGPDRGAGEREASAAAARMFASRRAPQGRYCLSVQGRDPGAGVLERLGSRRKAFLPLAECASAADAFESLEVGPPAWAGPTAVSVTVTRAAVRGQTFESCTYAFRWRDGRWRSAGSPRCDGP